MKLKNELYSCFVRWVAVDYVPEYIRLILFPILKLMYLAMPRCRSLHLCTACSGLTSSMPCLCASLIYESCTYEELNLLYEQQAESGADDIGSIKTVKAVESWHSKYEQMHTLVVVSTISGWSDRCKRSYPWVQDT